MKDGEHTPGSDIVCVLDYLRRRPSDFISSAEISREADSGSRFLADRNWVRPALARLLELHLAESNGSGNYRLKIGSAGTAKSPTKKFISPQIEMLLRNKG